MQPIYVEVSDEITTVIERMKQSEEASLVLVVPKGAVLLQSIVNLKLAKKAAADVGKPITLVTTDKIGRNLAAQVGVPVASKVDEAPSSSAPEEGAPEPTIIDGVKVHRYYDNPAVPEEDPAAAPLEPIVPREILREATPEDPKESPIVVREIATPKPLPPTAPAPIEIPEPAPAATAAPAPEPEKKPVETVSGSTATAPSSEKTPPAATAKKSSPEKPAPGRKRRKALMFFAYLLLLALLGTTGVSAFFLPKTAVSLVVPAEPWTKDLTTEATPDSTTLAPEVLKIEVNDSISTKPTGTKELGDKASGTAKVYNGASTSDQTLPSGTTISANGHSFTTTKEVSVPGYTQDPGKSPVFGSASVTITANDAGTDSNLSGASGQITSPQTSLIVQDITTTGGTSKIVAVVTATDIANTKAALVKKLREAADTKVVVALQNRSVVFDAATDVFTTDSLNANAIAGAETESLEVTGHGLLKRTLNDKGKGEAAVRTQLASGWEKGRTYVIDSVTLNKITIRTDGTATITSTSKGRSSATIETASIPKDLAGKKRDAGEAYLKSKLPQGTIVMPQTPAWWPLKNFPYSARYLTVQVTYE